MPDLAADAAGVLTAPLERALYHPRNQRPIDLSGLYVGQSLVLICSGPSLATTDLDAIRASGVVTMGVNNSWTLYRPDIWLCVDSPGRFVLEGWQDPGVLKLCPVEHLGRKLRQPTSSVQFGDVETEPRHCPNVLGYVRCGNWHLDQWFTPGGRGFMFGCHKGATCSEGFRGIRSVMLAAVHLAYWLGFADVFIVGADFRMTCDNPYAFQQGRPDNVAKANNIAYRTIGARLAAIDAKGRAEHDFRLWNCTPNSGLELPRLPLADALSRCAVAKLTPAMAARYYD